MTEVTRIIAAVVDVKNLTLYKQDGSTIVIAQGDPRIRTLIDRVVPDLETQKFSDVPNEELELTNYFHEAEKSTNGFIRFFKAVKEQVDSILDRFSENAVPVEPLAVGQVPGAEPVKTAEEQRPLTRSEAAVAEILANATPIAEVKDTTSLEMESSEDTVVAVLEDGTIIPGMEKLAPQFQAVVAKMGSVEGLTNFFRRVASVNRAHSVQDLLTFMQKGELPIADDGSVLVYKRLNPTSEPGVFVDVHSGNVRQRVGSHVFMDEKLVDANRRVDCSNGLHVARRDYLTAFSGSVTILAKLAPEDVIAVPHSDARKLRAKGYHIIAQLSAEDAARVCRNQPMKDKVLLGNAIKGNHVGILETVEITAHHGGGLKVNKVSDAPAEVVLDEKLTGDSIDNIEKAEGTTVDGAAVASAVAAAQATGKSVRQVTAEKLYAEFTEASLAGSRLEAAKQLLDYKKRAKVSWDKLGLNQSVQEELVKAIEANGMDLPETVAEALPKTVPSNDDKVLEELTGGGTPRQRIRALLNQTPLTKDKAEQVAAIKGKAKKGWAALGVSPKEEAAILKLTSK